MRGTSDPRLNLRRGLGALSLLAVVALLVSGGSAVAKHHHRGGGGTMAHLQFMTEWLELDESQQQQAQQILTAAKTELDAMAPPDWLSVVTRERFDQQLAQQVAEQSRQQRLQRQVIMLRTQHTLYHQVLTPEQQARYREKMRQWRPGHWKMKHGQMRRYRSPGA